MTNEMFTKCKLTMRELKHFDISKAPEKVQQAALAIHQAMTQHYWENRNLKKPKIPEAMERVEMIVLREVRFGSGKIALAKDQVVWAELYDSGTAMVYDRNGLGTEGSLLYTFNPEHNAPKYLAFIKK